VKEVAQKSEFVRDLAISYFEGFWEWGKRKNEQQ